MYGKKSSKRISDLLLFLYAWFSCFNQYFQFLGIPLFMFVLACLVINILFSSGFRIRINMNRKELPVLTATVWVIYGFIFALCLNNQTGWRYLLLVSTNIIGYCVVITYCSQTAEAKNAVVKGLIVGMICNLLIATWEVSTGNHIVPLTEAYIRRFKYKPLGFFANTNDFSIVILSIAIVLICWFVQRKRSKVKSVLFLTLVLFSIYILIYANSTTCIILMPFMVVLSGLFYLNRKNDKKWFLTTIIGLTTVLFVILLGGLDIVISRYFGEVDFTTISGRSSIWNAAMQAFFQSKWIGIGPGQSSVKAMGLAHNIVIELLTEYGIFVFILILISYGNILKHQLRKNSNLSSCIGKVFAIMVVPMSIATSSLTKLFPFWIAFALIISINQEEAQ